MNITREDNGANAIIGATIPRNYTEYTSYSDWLWKSLQDGVNDGSSIAYMSLSILTVLVHVLGLYLLLKSRKFNANTALIVSLSVCEIAYCLLDLTFDCAIIIGSRSTSSALHFIKCCIMIPAQYCIMVLITANRSLGTRHPLRYNVNATRKKLVGSVILTFTGASVIIGVISGLHSLHYDRKDFRQVLKIYVHTYAIPWMIAYIFYVLLCIFTYTNIYVSLAKSRQGVDHSTSNETNPSLQKFIWNHVFHHRHVAPLFIVGTYLLLVAMPFVASVTCFLLSMREWGLALLKIYGFGHKLNPLSDALIYIFLDTRTRSRMRKQFNDWHRPTTSIRLLRRNNR